MLQHFRHFVCKNEVFRENRARGSLLLCIYFLLGCGHWHCRSHPHQTREISQQHLSALWWSKWVCAACGFLPGLDQVSIKRGQSNRSDVGSQSKLTYRLLFCFAETCSPQIWWLLVLDRWDLQGSWFLVLSFSLSYTSRMMIFLLLHLFYSV